MDLYLDISELDTGRLGLRGSVMQPLLDLLEEEDEDEVQGWLFSPGGIKKIMGVTNKKW